MSLEAARSAGGVQHQAAEDDIPMASILSTSSMDTLAARSGPMPTTEGGRSIQLGTKDGGRQGGSSPTSGSYKLLWKTAPLANGRKKAALLLLLLPVLFFHA